MLHVLVGGKSDFKAEVAQKSGVKEKMEKRSWNALRGMQCTQLHGLTWKMREQRTNELGIVLTIIGHGSIFSSLSITTKEPMKTTTY